MINILLSKTKSQNLLALSVLYFSYRSSIHAQFFILKQRISILGTISWETTNVVRSGKRGNICVGNNVSATMCPRLPGPLNEGYKAGLYWLLRPW